MRDTANEAYRNDLLQRAREETGKNNSVIAKETGLSRPTVIAIMDGDMSIKIESIRAVAKCVGLSLQDLFTKVARKLPTNNCSNNCKGVLRSAITTSHSNRTDLHRRAETPG